MSVMKDEMLRRFPDAVQSMSLDDTDGDYLVAGFFVDWISGGGIDPQDEEQVARVRDFCDWCWSQPRGESAADDIPTIFTVGFFEDLCTSSVGTTLVPQIVDKDYFTERAEYLKGWIGVEVYDNILAAWK